MSSLEQKFDEFAKKNEAVKEADIASIFDEAKPVDPEHMIGQWKGGSFNTGHPTHELLKTVKWAGKNFRTVDDVEPIMLYDEAGARVWAKDYGNAQLRELKFRGVISTAMIYDKLPIIDSFRHISDNVVIGAMDNKELPKEAGTYYFYLRKIAE
ncbi:hypothetical protein N7494_002620 [Penicillium frequentans]|uniref:GXWXG domain-containing protein n=1 Tax=Penicillium frequentans TaxID=3151616 RepID=A0AAD6GI20_9EURO|nr:hypothetical protein N7494_002620 [Penicillium glabrum]